MVLKNSQYDAVMRHYDEIREKHLHLQRQRTEEIYAKLPEIASLDSETAVRSLEAAKARISDPAADLADYRSEMQRIRERRLSLLRDAGYPDDYLELTHSCPLCKDTGFIDGQHCRCFDRAAADIIYGRKALREILRTENFEHFSFIWYSDRIEDGAGDRSPLEDARKAYSEARAFTEKIGTENSNLYIYGNTGVGKTFLTHCIAADALDAGYSVLYFSASELFNYLADAAFGRSGSGNPGKDLLDDCDLLIIDDLGTEIANAFSGSELFRLISGRAMNRHSTIISTNLALGELSAMYSERVFSRIMSSYSILRITGGDIRVMKKLQGV